MAYVIKWKSNKTGATGQGEPYDDIELLRSWVEQMNAEHPHIRHWVEAVSTRTPGLGAFDRDWSGVNIGRKKR